jgi:hypothetical protein
VVFEPGPQGTLIAVHYEIRQRYGYQQQISRLPVPPGREQEAYNVATQIAAANGIGLSVNQ